MPVGTSRPLWIVAPPLATFRPLNTVAPVFKEVVPLATVRPPNRFVPPETDRPPFDIFWPPLTDTVERKIEEGMVGVPLGGGYTAPFTELTLIFAVLIKTVLRLFILAVLFTIRGVSEPTKRFGPFTVAPPFKNTPLVVVNVLLKDVGTL